MDTDLYSRQIYTYGLDTMEKIINLKILIVGLRGLGIEIAKNLILSGPKEVSIYDRGVCKTNDLGSNFYIEERDINVKTREKACYEKLKLLNKYVKVTIYKSDNIIEYIKEYNLIIITEIMRIDELYEINNICRNNKIGFIYTLNFGLTGFLFNDFGETHIINNINGEKNLTYNIFHINKKEKAYEIYLDITEDNLFNLKDGDYIIFKQVKGFEELNDGIPRKIISSTHNSFLIDNNDKNNIGLYESGGIIEEIKIPIQMKFSSFKENFINPNKDVINLDTSKKNINQLLHCAFVGLHKYYTLTNKLPDLNNSEEINQIIELFCYKFYEESIKKGYEWLKMQKHRKSKETKFIEFNKSYIIKVLSWCKSEINPICSFLGGIVSQEAIKITGKYNPIHQWLRFDFFELVENLPKNCNRKLLNCRYDDQIAIFGQTIQEKLSKLNMFMIGAGALGCEYLKNFSLMGIACHNNESDNIITVTDNDNIVISNLNRQFLFRNSDIEMSKSSCACREAKKINNKINLISYKHLLCDETKNIFNDIFWDKQDIIISAVDNLSARKYIDNQCTFYNKIFIDSGTQGTKANSDIYYPNKTICLNDLSFSVKKQIASCTLKNFPSKIEHCIEWSKSFFLELFQQNISDIKIMIEDKMKFDEILNEKMTNEEFFIELQKIKYLIDIINNPNKKIIIMYGIYIFKYCFEFSINETLRKFPLDSKEGMKYWNNYRKAPKAIKIDCNDKSTINFFKSFYYILGNIIKYDEKNLDENELKNIIINEDRNIELNFKTFNNEELMKEFKKYIINYIDKNNGIQKKINLLYPISFDKDNDENQHINMIMSMSNLRAKNYQIQECDFLRTKEIAGNIIPAIASTTAAITGLSCLQIYNILQTDNIDYYRSTAFNLGISEFNFFIPEEKRLIEDIQKTKETPEFKAITKFTVWDKIDLKGPNMKVNSIIDYFDKEYNVEIDNINYYNINLASPFLDGNIDFNKTIEELIEEKTGKHIDSKTKYIELNINGSIGDAEILTPKIRYCL